MSQKIQKTTVKGVLKRGNNILFVKDIKGVWELPGGKIDFGENPKDTLKREFKEELGWNDIKIGKIINIWDFTSHVDDIDYHFVVLVYECFSDEEDITHCDECTEYKWIPISEVDNLNMRDGYKNAIKEFAAKLGRSAELVPFGTEKNLKSPKSRSASCHPTG